MLRTDNRASAIDATTETSDHRVKHFWDPSRLLGHEWGRSLALNQSAWDVYLLFDRNVKWRESAPVPAYWMHQLGAPGIKAPQLNADSLAAMMHALVVGKSVGK